MSIIQFILIVLLVGFAIVAYVVWQAWRKIHKTVDQFNKQFGGSTAQQEGSSRQQRTTTTDSGETIIDTRSQEDANRKIFSRDEGEYVDYKEIKE